MKVYLVNIGDSTDSDFWMNVVVCKDLNSVRAQFENCRHQFEENDLDIEDLLEQLAKSQGGIQDEVEGDFETFTYAVSLVDVV